MGGGEIVERGDDFVGHLAEELRRLVSARAVEKAILGDHPSAEERAVQEIERARPRGALLPDMIERGGGELVAQLRAIDDVLDAGGGQTAGRHGLRRVLRRIWERRAAPQDYASHRLRCLECRSVARRS